MKLVYSSFSIWIFRTLLKKWTIPIWNWSLTILHLAILFEGRLDESLNL